MVSPANRYDFLVVFMPLLNGVKIAKVWLQVCKQETWNRQAKKEKTDRYIHSEPVYHYLLIAAD
jgi:hypothetical protein